MQVSGNAALMPSILARRAVLESIVIVLSILFAFGIDAWWEERRDAADVRESLEVVRRDMVDTLSQLEEFVRFSGETAQASLGAARALIGPEPVAADSRPLVEAQLLRSISRRTMRLPKAGYTDLLNTGNLTEIDNRALRDRLVHFYETADRSQEIVEKNSFLFTDQGVKDALVTSGLLVPMPLEDEPTDLQSRRNVMMRDLMGPDFPTRPPRLWRLPVESPEIDQLVATLLQNARGALTVEVIARDTYDEATEVMERINEHLDNL